MLLIQYISRFKGWIKINIPKRDSQAIIQKLHFSDRICTRSRSLQTTPDNHYGFFRWRYVQKSWTRNILITKASRWRTSQRQRLAFLILPDYYFVCVFKRQKLICAILKTGFEATHTPKPVRYCYIQLSNRLSAYCLALCVLRIFCSHHRGTILPTSCLPLNLTDFYIIS